MGIGMTNQFELNSFYAFCSYRPRGYQRGSGSKTLSEQTWHRPPHGAVGWESRPPGTRASARPATGDETLIISHRYTTHYTVGTC